MPYNLCGFVHLCTSLNLNSEFSIESSHFSLQFCDAKLIFFSPQLKYERRVQILVGISWR